MRLVLVRHPRPEIAPGICYGRSDVAASGADTARVLAALSDAGLPGALPVVSSPAARCAALAGRLGAATLAFDPRLLEMDFGAWELRAWDAIARDEIDAWAADLAGYRPGGGESVLAVARRAAALLGDLRASGPAAALLVCHAGTMRLLQALHAGHAIEAAARHAAATPHRIGYGEILLLG